MVVPELAVGRVPLDPLGRVPDDAPEDAEPVGAPLGAEPELGEVPVRVVPFAPDGVPPPPPLTAPGGPTPGDGGRDGGPRRRHAPGVGGRHRRADECGRPG